jgi:hypothetical protein
MLKNILCGATLLCAAGVANAATVTFSDIVAVSPTNFTTTLDLAKFDTMSGTRVLEAVTFSIDGSIFGSAEVESRDSRAAIITSTLEAQLTLSDADSRTLVVTIPTIINMFNASAYDGVNDFGGTSGATFNDLNANQSEQRTFLDAATLAFFTSVGMDNSATFTFDAKASSVATGAGNLTSAFNTTAGGLVSVVYTYSDMSIPVSAPSHIALLGLGLLAFAGVRKARK